MSDKMADSQTERDEVQLVKEEKLPSTINIETYVPEADRKGYRFRSTGFTTVHQVKRLKQLHYDMYKKHPWLRAAVEKIAKVAVTVGHDIKYVGKGEVDENAKMLIENFFKSPNQTESFADIMWVTVIQLKLNAECFWEVVKASAGYPKDFYTLNGDISPNVDLHGYPIKGKPAYVQKVMSEEANFDYDEVIWIKFSDPFGKLRPTSQFESLEQSTLLDIYAMKLNKSIFTRGVKKGKAFIFPGQLGEEQIKRNRAQISMLHEGIEGAYSAFIALEGECEIKDLKLEETKMEGKDLREYVRDEMLGVIGTPISKLGISQTQVKESQYINKTFFQEEIKPILDLIQNKINSYLDLLGIYDYRFIFKKTSMSDQKDVARLVDVLSKHGAVSLNEIREMVGLSPKHNTTFNKPFIMFKDGTFIFCEEMYDNRKKIIEERQKKKKEQPTFSFDIGPRRITRKGTEFPSLVDDINWEEEDTKDEIVISEKEGEDVHPFP